MMAKTLNIGLKMHQNASQRVNVSKLFKGACLTSKSLNGLLYAFSCTVNGNVVHSNIHIYTRTCILHIHYSHGYL